MDHGPLAYTRTLVLDDRGLKWRGGLPGIVLHSGTEGVQHDPFQLRV